MGFLIGVKEIAQERIFTYLRIGHNLHTTTDILEMVTLKKWRTSFGLVTGVD